MKAKLIMIAGVALPLVLCAWQSPDQQGIDNLQWLNGTWENKTARGSIYESWQKINDSVMTGRSYAIRNGDTLVFEQIRLVREQGQVFYIPVVKNQNGGLPVRFKLVAVSASGMVFENPEHDFPQRITYNRNSPDELVAEISGNRGGQEKKQRFPMQRVR